MRTELERPNLELDEEVEKVTSKVNLLGSLLVSRERFEPLVIQALEQRIKENQQYLKQLPLEAKIEALRRHEDFDLESEKLPNHIAGNQALREVLVEDMEIITSEIQRIKDLNPPKSQGTIDVLDQVIQKHQEQLLSFPLSVQHIYLDRINQKITTLTVERQEQQDRILYLRGDSDTV